MVSRRNYIAITVIMLVVFILFFFLGDAKEFISDYGTNDYASGRGDLPPRESMWNGEAEDGRKAAFIGSGDSPYFDTANVWCEYSKTALACAGTTSEAADLVGGFGASVVMISPETVKSGDDVAPLLELADSGTVLIFLDMPEYALISENEALRYLLGIKRVQDARCRLTGVRLFDGFLLGGGAEYSVKNEEDLARQDLLLEVPWYETDVGTKRYAVGLLEDKTVENELLPPLIWRASRDGNMVFGVCGGFLKDVSGIGILSAMLYESQKYQLYPVVNAQLFTVMNAPDLSFENSEEIREIYGRDMQQTVRDIIYPSLFTIYEKSGYPVNSFMVLRAFDKEASPDQDTLVYYLTLLKQHRSEMGISIVSPDGAGAAKTAEEFESFFSESGIEYQFRAVYADQDDLADVLNAAESGSSLLGGVNTVFTGTDRTQVPFGYGGDSVTVQRVTGDGFLHTFYDNFMLKSYETAVGYYHFSVDMRRVVHPREGDIHWELLVEELVKSLTEYSKPFDMFDKVTVSESDRCIRHFLAMDYTQCRDGSTVTLHSDGGGEPSFFILRTHGESVSGTKGCTFERIESDAYLLSVTDDCAEIYLKTSKNRYYR